MDDAEVRERCVDGGVCVLGDCSVAELRAGRGEIIREVVEPQACGP